MTKYKTHSTPYLIFITLILSVLALTACGSSGGGPSSNQPSGTISGKAVKGTISGGTVTAYAVASGAKGSVLGTAITDSNGNYSISTGSYSGPVFLEIMGGSYIDETTGNPINLPTTPGSGLQAVVGGVTAGSNLDVQITPLTTMAAALAQAMSGGLTAANINAANQQVGDYFGGIDILSVQPVNPLISNSANGATQEAINYGLILAGFSQEAQALGLTNPLDLISAIVQDFSDGSFDGQSGSLPIQLNGSSMDPMTGTANLATAINTFSSDLQQNVSGGTVSPSLITSISNPTPAYAIGGTVTGLTGTGLVLQNNGGDNLAIGSDGSFAFSTELANGNAYSVTVGTPPSGQTCTVNNGSGTVGSANITDVIVSCTTSVPSSYTIGGTVTGLTGTGLVLRNNGGDNRAINFNGSFTFNTALASGSAYSVTVFTQPSGQTCSVTSGSGTVGSANIYNVSVSCVTLGPTTPASPTGVTATPGDGQVTISWDAVTGATSYNIYVATQAGVNKTSTSLTCWTKISNVTSPYLLNISGTACGSLSNGTPYFMVVTAVNAAGESVESTQVSATPQTTIPGILNRILAGDAKVNDRFGISVDIDGDYAIAGTGRSDGTFYIFHRTGLNTWDNGTKLNVPEPLVGTVNASFAISGDYAIVGSPENDDGGTIYNIQNAGAAYIFHRTGINSWDSGTKIASPKALTSGSFTHFGASVDISGDYAIVGTTQFVTGPAYIFYRTGPNSWDSGTAIGPSDGSQPFDVFGVSVAINGDYAIVGAEGRDGFSGNLFTDGTGAAYIYQRTGTNSWEGTKITASDAQQGDFFGHSVDIDGDYAIVGSGGRSVAYVFRRTEPNLWNNGTKITVPDAQQIVHKFGGSVGISGDHAIVGAEGRSAVYLFRRTAPDTWIRGTHLTALMPSDGQTGDRFGHSVAISGNYAIVGADGRDNAKGAAYTFLSNIDDVTEPLTPDAPMGITLSAGDGQLTVSWPEVFDAAGYNLFVASEPGLRIDNYGSLPNGARYASLASPFTVTGLVSGTPYYFLLTAFNNVGEGAPSLIVWATPVSLAALYFTGTGQTPQEAINVRQTAITARITGAQNDLLQVTGDLATRQQIQAGLLYLNSDDGEAVNYGGVVKGRIKRLIEEIIPFWQTEELTSKNDPDWNQFVRDELALQNSWRVFEQATLDFLNDQNLYYISCDRYFCAIFLTPQEIKSRRTDLLNQEISLLQTELSLLETSLGIFSAAANTYTIGGVVTGLTGTGLVLQNNGGDDLAISSNGTFTFSKALASGSAHSVTVITVPSEQNCTVTNGTGTVGSTNVTTVSVSCTTITYTIGGTVTGLTGAGLALHNNGGNGLAISSNGSFTFSTALANGSAYSVTVSTPPSGQDCDVANGSGTVGSANITDVSVSCTTSVPTSYTIGGTVTGLTGNGLVIQNNGGDNLAINSNGSFTFSTALAGGSAYSVMVSTQPNGQTCTVTSGSGTVGTAGVSNVSVACATTTYTIGGTVTGLTAPGLVLQNNGGDNLAISASGSFTFSTPLVSGIAYSVTVSTQPSGQTCTVTNGNGTVVTANITDVTITCSALVATKLVITTAAQTVSEGSVSGAVTFRAEDSSGNLVTSSAAVANLLTTSGTMTFSTTSGFTTTVGNITLSGGIGIFYFKDTTVGSPMITVASTGLTSAMQTETIVRNGAPPIAAGWYHTCGMMSDGSVKCWGGNSSGQLGNGTNIYSSVPVSVSGISSAVAIAAGWYHSCALLSNGLVQCWGGNSSGQLGNGTTTNSASPVTVSGITSAIAIAAGGQHSCALLSSGLVKCWGGNSSGQLGNGTTTNSKVPVTVSGISSAVTIAVGGNYSCAVLSNGSVQCWGFNSDGQLGNGTTTNSNVPVTVSGISSAVAISAGGVHTCALLSGGSIQCWGNNSNGQMGNGTTTNSNVPVTVNGISSPVAIAAGLTHSCAVISNGSVQCWGANGRGQLGNGVTTGSKVPVNASGISSAIAITAGLAHNCALLSNNSVQCWGFNNYGQVGDGTTIYSQVPVTVSGISSAIAVAAGARYHSCSLLSSGSVQCWGGNNAGNLGDGTTTDSSVPVTVNGISSAIAIAAGGDHSCAVLSSGTVQCWGANTYGQLGNGTTTLSYVPVTVSGISSAVAIATGYDHTCALLLSGSVQCWGWNYAGQLGNGTTTNSSVPVTVSGISTAVVITAGGYHSCALLSSGLVQCWGSNLSGGLGNGTTTNSSVPVTVSGISSAVAIAAGGDHSCAILSGGSVKCWGANYYGQLGVGSFSNSSVPVTVSGITSAIAITGGGYHSCASLSSGSVKCWGNNYLGQLGDGTATPSSVPVTVGGITSAVGLAAGGQHSCALLSGGLVQCWGENYTGELGDGRKFFSTFPVTVSGIY